MLNIIQNTIGAIRRVGESVVRAGLKMWLPFTKAEPLGENLVVNGDFSTDSDWTVSTQSDISSGKARILSTDGSHQYIQQSNSGFTNTQGKFVKITLDIVEYVSGTIKAQFSGGSNYSFPQSIGTHTLYVQNDGSAGTFNIARVSGVTDITIDNVSVEEYAQETPDISGNDNNAILKTGKALQFSGNDSVQTSFPSSYTIKTIAFWINPTHSSTNEVVFYGGGAMAGTRELRLDHLQLEAINSNITMSTYVNGTLEGVTSGGTPATLTQDDWQRVVLTSSAGFSVVSDTFDIGSGLYGSDGRFIMSDLQIYDEAWTTDDIAYDYANPQKLVTDSEDTSITLDNLKAWWHLSEGDGTVAFDSAPLLGVEEITNGNFESDSDWTVIDGGWTISNKEACHTGSASFIEQNTNLITGRTYKVVWTISSHTTQYVGISSLSGTRFGDFAKSAEGTYVAYLVSNGNNFRLYSTGDNCISNVSVKEVYNIDGETYDGSTLGASYVDAQERIPQLGMMNWSKGSNLIEYSEDLTYWSPLNGAVRSFDSDIVNPDGTVGCWKVTFDGTTNGRVERPVGATGLLTYSVWLKVDSGTQPAQIGGSTNGALSITVTDEWQRFIHTQTYTSSTTYPRLRCDVNGAEIYMWGAQYEYGTTASAYRRTNGSAVTDATLISSATDSQKDILGNAVRVKGSGFNLDGTGYAEVPHTTDFDFGTGDFSVSAWVKFGFVYQGSGINVIFSNGKASSSGTNNGFHLIVQSDGFYFRMSNGTITETIQILSSPTTDNWYHIVITRSGTDLNTYIDKVGTSHTVSSIDVDTSNPLKIGVDTINNRYYNYKIDDVILYDTELSSDEVEQNYNATKSGHNN